MGEVQNEERLEVMLLTGRKVITIKVITLDLVIDNIIFTQQCFVQPITNPILLGSGFFYTFFLYWTWVVVLSPCVVLITCLLPASPMILCTISIL